MSARPRYLTQTLVLATALSIGTVARAAESAPPPLVDLEPVRNVWLPTIDDYQVVNRSTLILWSSPNRGYLLQLRRPIYRAIDFDAGLRLTSTGHLVYPRFDAAVVDGIRYPIEAIYKINREQAKVLRERR